MSVVRGARVSRGPPAVTLTIPPNRDYTFLLQQTKAVYNRLLSDKFDKLLHGILTKKQYYDDICDEMVKEDQQKVNTLQKSHYMLATPKNVLFPGHNYLLTTGTDDSIL